jgi:hypothetical protein
MGAFFPSLKPRVPILGDLMIDEPSQVEWLRRKIPGKSKAGEFQAAQENLGPVRDQKWVRYGRSRWL